MLTIFLLVLIFISFPNSYICSSRSVYEIETVIDRLIYKVDSAEDDNDPNLLKLSNQITNWETVLSNYRTHNEDMFAMFTFEDLQYRKMVSMFSKFKDDGVTVAQINDATEDLGSGTETRQDKDSRKDKFKRSFKKIDDAWKQFVTILMHLNGQIFTL